MIDAANPTPLIETTLPAATELLAAIAAVQAMQAELATMRAESATRAEAEAVKAAEAEAKATAEATAKMTEAQKTIQEVEGLKARIAAQEAREIEQARNAMLDALGADPAYRRVFPEGDCRDPKVKAQVEKFAADHPRLLTRQPGPPQPNVPDLASKMQGRPLSKLVNPEAMRASYESAAAALGGMKAGKSAFETSEPRTDR